MAGQHRRLIGLDRVLDEVLLGIGVDRAGVVLPQAVELGVAVFGCWTSKL